MESEALKIRGLTKTFPQFALGPLDLTVPRGAIYGFIGPNGSGKSTTLDLIMGMGAKDGGEITVFGMDHVKQEVEVKKRVGYFSQDTSFDAWGRVDRLVSFFRGFYPNWDDEYCRHLAATFGIRWDARIATLSFGERTRLGLLLAMSHRPQLLILDEPVTGLDAIAKRDVYAELLEVVQSEDRSVVISSHHLDDIQRFADQVGLIKNGTLFAEGAVQDLLRRFRIVDATIRDGFSITSVPGAILEHQHGRRVRFLLDTVRTTLHQLVAPNFEDATLSDSSLEDVFVAVMKQ